MAILITEDAWLNSQLSIARFYGGITLRDSSMNGTHYIIMQPKNDLVDMEYVKYYTKLGRDKFIEILEEHPTVSKTALMVYFNAAMAKEKEKKKPEKETKQLSLFE